MTLDRTPHALNVRLYALPASLARYLAEQALAAGAEDDAARMIAQIERRNARRMAA